MSISFFVDIAPAGLLATIAHRIEEAALSREGWELDSLTVDRQSVVRHQMTAPETSTFMVEMTFSRQVTLSP